MNLLIIIVLAIVQGATEFLPVSSSGHLVLLYKIFGIENNKIGLSVILHLATLVSVIIYQRKDIIKLISKPFCATNIRLIISTIITCILALILKPLVERSFDGSWLSIGFVITAVVLLVSQIISDKRPNTFSHITTLDISIPKSIAIGVAQGIACFPAISRSGSTIATALISGVDRDSATTYSFLLSIPIILASTILEIIDYASNPLPMQFSVIELIIGFVVATIVGILAIKFMFKIVNSKKLYFFSFYLLLIAIVSMLI